MQSSGLPGEKVPSLSGENKVDDRGPHGNQNSDACHAPQQVDDRKLMCFSLASANGSNTPFLGGFDQLALLLLVERSHQPQSLQEAKGSCEGY